MLYSTKDFAGMLTPEFTVCFTIWPMAICMLTVSPCKVQNEKSTPKPKQFSQQWPIERIQANENKQCMIFVDPGGSRFYIHVLIQYFTAWRNRLVHHGNQLSISKLHRFFSSENLKSLEVHPGLKKVVSP